ncbi:hypothetical protein Golob_000654 [Gossypium lobatum]|uniref:Uncharacterized protein n=1 Tax=Gossypium lobatum TaxID=34289 RepID=A0A7J8N8N7_9ROSI|nr:hypothetical protein [Gossypium lobatum]
MFSSLMQQLQIVTGETTSHYHEELNCHFVILLQEWMIQITY